MPLVLSLRQSDDMFIGDQQFEVTRIYNETSFTLTRREENADDEKSFEISEREAVEVLPNVFVSAGDLFQRGIIRAVIDAPRSIMILRGDNYRDGPKHGT
jgi:hypothetical protein